MMTGEIQMVLFLKASGEKTLVCVYVRQVMQLKKHLGAVSKQTALIGRCWGEMLDNVEHTL